MIPRYFIDHPIGAVVVSILLVLGGGLAFTTLPIAQYPDVVPPQVVITAFYPGANAETVSKTVATPIELEINGVENMLYIESQCTNDGAARRGSSSRSSRAPTRTRRRCWCRTASPSPPPSCRRT